MEPVSSTALSFVVGATIATIVTLLARRRRPRGLDTQAELVRNDVALLRESIAHLDDLMQRTDGEGKANFAQITETLRNVDVRTSTLTNALGNSRVRGKWGERAAEDIMRVAGLVEGSSYFKQRSVNGVSAGSRPDFSFPLPDGSSVNMDVKFPLENYARSVEADNDADRATFDKAFVRDVRNKIKEVATRSYIDPANGTLDYVLLFIPSESVYAEINRLDPTVIDAALSQHVVLCSPLSLFAVLAVVRRSVESFAFQQASDDVLRIMASFDREWGKFSESLAILGRQLATVRGTYDQLTGPRMRALETPLAHVDSLRRERGLTPAVSSPSIDSSAIDDAEGDHVSWSGLQRLELRGARLDAPDGHRPQAPAEDR
jgi:DNA recombination protein RmuC